MRLFGVLFVQVAVGIQFFHLTDIHLEPFYDPSNLYEDHHVCRRADCMNGESPTCVLFAKKGQSSFDNYGRPGCDPPLDLLTSMLAAMKAQNPNPEFITIAGDYNAHKLQAPLIVKVQEKVTDLLRQYFPKTMIFYGIGNNDMDPPDMNTNATFQRLYDLFSRKGNISENERSTFLHGGYWHYHNTTSGLRVILLNSNLFYEKIPHDPYWDRVAVDQLDWLEEKLKKARDESTKVIINSHVPPGRAENADDWHSASFARFQTLIQDYPETVLLQIYGHHSTEMIRGLAPTFGLVIATGVAPRTSAYPTYQVVHHNYTAPGQSTGVVNEISTYMFDLVGAASGKTPSWDLLYNMAATYGVPDLSQKSLYDIINKITALPQPNNYSTKYFTLQMRPPKDVNDMQFTERQQLICETAVGTAEAVAKCVSDASSAVVVNTVTKEPSSSTGEIVAVSLITIAVLTVGAALLFHIIKKRADAENGRKAMMVISD